VPFAVGLFSLGTPFVYFSSQVKQYSSDVAAALLMLLAAIEIRRRGVTPRRAWLLGLAGAAIVWFSQPALFVLVGIGTGLAILVWTERDGKAARALLITGALWSASSAAAAVHALRSITDADREYFRTFWADGFMPIPPRAASDVFWVFSKLTWAFGAFGSGMSRTTGGLNYRWSWVFTVVMLAGVWSLWKSRRDVALFLVLPLIVVVTLSAAELYPFTARLFAFLLPGLLLATAAGASRLVSVCPPRLSFLIPAGLAVLGGAPLYAAATALPPFWLQHLRPVIEHVIARREPGDGIYVYFGAAQAYHYYAPRFGLPTGDAMIGGCAVGTPREYLRQLDHFRGRNRAWIMLSHAHHNGAEARLILEYLDHIGRRVETIAVPGTSGRWLEGAWGYLYDLSDRNRLASASSQTFPIPDDVVPELASRWDCYGVALSESARAVP
jgi:hypothetical protein